MAVKTYTPRDVITVARAFRSVQRTPVKDVPAQWRFKWLRTNRSFQEEARPIEELVDQTSKAYAARDGDGNPVKGPNGWVVPPGDQPELEAELDAMLDDAEVELTIFPMDAEAVTNKLPLPLWAYEALVMRGVLVEPDLEEDAPGDS